MPRPIASVIASARASERAGDPAAARRAVPRSRPRRFDEVVQVHEPMLTRLAERLCRSHADARDLVQDTFERALRAWDRLPEDANARAWLVTILNNLFLDRCRRARRQPRVEGPARVLEVPSPESAAPQPWAEVTADEVRDALAQLDVEFRRAYELHALEGRSYRQIAEELGIPTSTVGTRLLRARTKLRHILLHRIGAAEGDAP